MCVWWCRYLATVPILVAKLRIDTLVNAKSQNNTEDTEFEGENVETILLLLRICLFPMMLSPLALAIKFKVTRKGNDVVDVVPLCASLSCFIRDYAFMVW